jgi:hypothetical protein
MTNQFLMKSRPEDPAIHLQIIQCQTDKVLKTMTSLGRTILARRIIPNPRITLGKNNQNSLNHINTDQI